MISGTKTQRVVADAVIMGRIISLLPKIAAIGAFAPRSRYLWTFSRITIEPSSVIPMPMIRPVMVSRLSVKPKMVMHIRVSNMEMGMASPIMKVPLKLRRNRNSKIIARSAPCHAFEYTWFSVALIMSVLSERIPSVIPCGRESLISPRAALMLSETFT